MAAPKPNFLVIFGDDIGWSNISAYHHGMLGYQTPNIDRLAHEGAMFTDYYTQQSCTAGRAAFVLGQHPYRTGLLTIGMPGSPHGITKAMPTIADLLKPLGYATGQFGKNHLGDRDEHLPTMHGFDEFFGNLYHLNAEEEPETYYYPRDPEFRKKFGPRGVLHAWADGQGGQRVEDTGPLTRDRMPTVDEEFLGATVRFIETAARDGKPFFVWFNTTRMHVWTHLKKESIGKTGVGLYADGMVETDGHVGQLLQKLDDLGLTDDTVVVYTTDNGAETVTWPDGGNTPFRGEKGTTWEGGFRSPCLVRWPGVVKPGTVYNAIMSGEDWLPTFLAAAGEPNIKDRLLRGHKVGARTFKAHLDGYDFLPFFRGETNQSPRKEIFYFDQGGSLNAVRYEDWKIHFTILKGAINVATPEKPAWPVVVNLRADPYERAPDQSGMYVRWYADNMWIFVPIQEFVGRLLESFKEFPPAGGSSLSVDQALATVTDPTKATHPIAA